MLTDGQLLYHGSYAEVSSIDLSRCAREKDFGQGFYLTDSYKQARSFIPTSLRKARGIGVAPGNQSFGFVTTFRVRLDPDLAVFEFPDADAHWLRFVSINRRSGLAKGIGARVDRRVGHADVIVGKIANDTTNAVITTYLNGLYGPVGSPLAEGTAISLLLPDRLRVQYCFRTGLAISCLSFEGAHRHDL